MRLLVLGGTAWLGGQVARTALERGHAVTCLARGTSGDVPAGAALVRADRTQPGALDGVAAQDWDAVVDVGRQPGQVREAARALAPRTAHAVFVSTGNVYADTATPGLTEGAPLLPPLDGDVMESMATYGEAKVACEQAVAAAFGAERALLARAGLIGGPGDPSGRTGYWPLRFARPAGPGGAVLVPDDPDLATQVVDVRDLAGWLVDAAERRTAGAYSAVGDRVPLHAHLATAREVAGHTGPVVAADPAWLVAQGVQEWSGPRSLPLWLADPGWRGFADHDGSAARAAGLAVRPLAETLADTLAWELGQGPDRPRSAGLSPDEERALLALLA
jgi:nucleoside-diphosphate-sugar epimerase